MIDSLNVITTLTPGVLLFISGSLKMYIYMIRIILIYFFIVLNILILHAQNAVLYNTERVFSDNHKNNLLQKGWF